MNTGLRSFLTLSGLLISGTALAQSANEAENIRSLEEKNFVFVAQMALPQRGRSFPLTTRYDVVVNSDSIIAFLPYFGRAYTAPLNPAEGGIRFTSTDFSYSSKKKRKKGYEILVKPNDFSEVISMRFTAFASGSATLQVINLNKDAINFNGYIEPGRERPKKAF